MDILRRGPPPGGTPTLDYARKGCGRGGSTAGHFARAAYVAAFTFGFVAVSGMAMYAAPSLSDGTQAVVMGAFRVVAVIVAAGCSARS